MHSAIYHNQATFCWFEKIYKVYWATYLKDNEDEEGKNKIGRIPIPCIKYLMIVSFRIKYQVFYQI